MLIEHVIWTSLYVQNSKSWWKDFTVDFVANFLVILNIELGVSDQGKKSCECWHHSLRLSSKPKHNSAEPALEWQAKVEHFHTERRPQHNLIHSLKPCPGPGRLLHHMAPQIISLWSNKHTKFKDRAGRFHIPAELSLVYKNKWGSFWGHLWLMNN